MRKKFVTGIIVLGSFLLLSGCFDPRFGGEIESSPPDNSSSNPSSNDATVDGLEDADSNEADNGQEIKMNAAAVSGWQTYVNDKHNYKVMYPAKWFFLKDACCPPPPTGVNLNNYSAKKIEYSAHQMEKNVYGMEILCLYEAKINDIGEVQLLKQEGVKNESVTINGFSAIKFSREVVPGDASEIGYSYYVVGPTEGCRISYSNKCLECDNIISTFKFTN